MYTNMNTDTDLYTYTGIKIHAGAGRATVKHGIYTHIYTYVDLYTYANI